MQLVSDAPPISLKFNPATFSCTIPALSVLRVGVGVADESDLGDRRYRADLLHDKGLASVGEHASTVRVNIIINKHLTISILSSCYIIINIFFFGFNIAISAEWFDASVHHLSYFYSQQIA